MKTIYYIAISEDDQPIVMRYTTREGMLSAVKSFKKCKIEVLCVWTENE